MDFSLPRGRYLIMRMYIKRATSLALAIILLFAPILFEGPVTEVYAETKNVKQSRRIADISEFPGSYQDGLTRIKNAYPNARFIYYHTDLDWYNDVLQEENELRYGRNLITATAPESWRSEEAYDTTTQSYKHVEPGWIQASTEIIEYYMDPRNFLDERNIFQFVALTYDESQTVSGIQSILDGTFMSNATIIDNNGKTITYAEALVQIGKETDVSPYLLAIRVIQEQGGGGKSAMISGSYSKVPGYYNHFNICAYGSSTEAILTHGLEYARGQGWDTPYKSLLGGAWVLASSYVGDGKDCLYLHHWNMAAKNGVVTYAPYMTNLQAPYYEARNLSSAHTDKSANYTFIIPVYDNMPEKACELPDGEGHGYLLKNLTVDGLDLGEFQPRIYSYQTNTVNASYVTIKIETNASAGVMINGINIDKGDETVIEKGLLINGGYNTIKVTAIASNGISRDYTIMVANDDGKPHFASSTSVLEAKATVLPNQTVELIKKDIQTMNCSVLVTDAEGKVKNNSDLCVYGDVIVIKDVDNALVYSANVVIDGDINKDGLVDDDDVDMIKKHILEIITLNVEEIAIADLDNDETISIADLGILKSLTPVDWTKCDADVTLTLDVPDTLYDDQVFSATISASEGTYCTEGYLIYNEGRLVAQDEENSGRIHFITDGDQVLFDNESDTVEFKSIVESGDIDFSVDIISAYDYALYREFEVVTDSVAKYIKNDDLNIALKLSSQSNNGCCNHATLTIQNTADKSIGNINVNLGEYLTTSSGKQSQRLTGLKKNHKHSLTIYTIDGLTSGQYSSVLTIKYQDAQCVEKLMSLPITFDIVNCAHENCDLSHDEATHTSTCNDCGNVSKEDHVYIRTAEDLYKCVCCNYSKNVKLSISVKNAIVNNYVSLSPVLTVDDKTVSTYGMTSKWYIDGEETSSRNLLFRSVGYRTIDCVLTTKDGAKLHASTMIYVQPQKTYGINPIVVEYVTCRSIKIQAYENYEYKLGDGEWQDTPHFINLNAGEEYEIQQRLKGSKYAISLKVKASHAFDEFDTTHKCGFDVTKTSVCSFCGDKFLAKIPETTRKHVFVNYKITSEATCTKGSTCTAICEYECGAKNEIIKDDVKAHSYSNYVTGESFDCENGGLVTAQCDYGCGQTHILPSEASFGHDYHYVKDNNATATSSMTETGTCIHCGQVNTRTVDGTRLQYVTEIHIEISKASINQANLPLVVTGDNTIITNVVWETSDGTQYSGNAKSIEIQKNETYKLVKLMLAADATHVLYNDVKLYVNGVLFTGTATLEDGIITYYNIGQFKF
jgi:beta-N-acetylglucosaminidase